jgi:hypothetical protein
MDFFCKYCGNKIKIVNVKLGAEDQPHDEYAGSLENMQGGTISDKSYNPKMDLLDKEWEYLGRGKRHYKPRTDRPTQVQHDMEGVSNVAFVIGDTLLVKCGNCKIVYAGIFPPESFDVYHKDEYLHNPQSPIGYSNETHQDNSRVHHGVEIPEEQLKNVNINKIVDKIKKKHYENKGEDNVENSG